MFRKGVIGNAMKKMCIEIISGFAYFSQINIFIFSNTVLYHLDLELDYFKRYFMFTSN